MTKIDPALIPMIRRIIPGVIATDIAGVQPMHASDEDAAINAMERNAEKLLDQANKLRALGLDEAADLLTAVHKVDVEAARWIRRQQIELKERRSNKEDVAVQPGPDVIAMNVPSVSAFAQIFSMKSQYFQQSFSNDEYDI